jgi:preprotein translocase subunit SecF
VARNVINTSSKLLGGFYMKGKLVLTIGFAGALTLSIGFAKDLQSTKVFAQTEQSKVIDEQTATNNGVQYRVISVEEQNRREGNVAEGKNVTTNISVEEQNMVENSSAQQGFVPHENGTGFFFTKVK